MAITITSTPGVVGPGATVYVNWGAGSTYSDRIYVFDTNNHVTGGILANGRSSALVLLGFDESPPAQMGAGTSGGVYGDACILQPVRFSAAGVPLDTGTTYSGFTFDPLGFLPTLLDKLYQPRYDLTSMLDTILSCVQKPYQLTG